MFFLKNIEPILVFGLGYASLSSVIMANWPGRADDLTNNNSLVCELYLFNITLGTDLQRIRVTVKMDYAYVLWKQQHPNHRIGRLYM